MSDAIYKIRKSTLDSIGDAIRLKSGKSDLFSPLDIPAEILSLSAGGGGPLTFTELLSSKVYGTLDENRVTYTTDKDYAAIVVFVAAGNQNNSNKCEIIAPGFTITDPIKSGWSSAGSTQQYAYGIDVPVGTAITASAEAYGYIRILGVESPPSAASKTPDGLLLSMRPTVSTSTNISYGTLTTGGAVQNADKVLEIFQINKTATTGFALKGTGYVRWEFPEPRTVQSFLTRTTYNYLGQLMVYGEKADGTLVPLAETDGSSYTGYGYNNASLLKYQASLDKTTEFVAVRMKNNVTNTSYTTVCMFLFWLG